MSLLKQMDRALVVGRVSKKLVCRRVFSSGGFRKQNPTFATRVIHAAQDPEQWPDAKPVVVPISLSTTFKQTFQENGKVTYASTDYSRTANPTRNVLEKVVANLEGAKHGLAFSSGMAAISMVFSLLSAGDHVVTMADLYGGTGIFLRQIADRLNIKTTFVEDPTDVANIEKAMQANTKLVWVESPSNPSMIMVDIEQIAKMVHKRSGILLAVDNTFLSSYFQRPLELGADIVMQSATKYLNGHSDVLMGVVVTSNDDVHARLRFLQNIIGAVPSPLECYLVNRGLKTLPVRMRQHMNNGLAVARYLEGHPAIERVLHPGLPSHPQHELAKRQCYGHSGMVTFFVKGGKNECRAFVNSLKVITLAESLGGFESLVKIPALMPEHYALGVRANLIRFSVGLEDSDDLIADLAQALEVVSKI